MRKFLRAMLCALLLMTLTVVPPVASKDSPVSVSSTAHAASSSMRILKTNVDNARLRKGPSSAYDVITTLDKGEKVFYSGKTKNSFSYVCTEGGKVGYIYSGFLSKYGIVRTSAIYYTRTKNVRLYKRPSTSASKVTTLRKQQFVIVYQKAGNWAYIRTLEGKAGYIQLSKIRSTGWAN